MHRIHLHSHSKCEMIDITPYINRLVKQYGTGKTACLVFAPHTTAAIVVNENADPDVREDILMGVSRLVPDYMQFKHKEGNSDAHIKASLLGASEIVPLENECLTLGTWQGIFFAEFDGPRSRTVLVNFL